MINGQPQNLAERIAQLLQENEKGNDDFSLLRASLEKINDRLDKIENKLESQNSTQTSSFITPPVHASQQKFENLEVLADQIINSLSNEKACPYEPTGKPCDHCAMCNSRGF